MRTGIAWGDSRNAALVVAVFAIVLGTALRFYALDRQAIWNDEAFTVQNITAPLRAAVYQPVNNHPPLYFAQLRLWRHLSGIDAHSIPGLAFLRANAALWGSISLILFYFLARRWFSPWLAAVSVAIMALSPLHLACSQDARPYSMALAEGIAGFLLVDWIVRTPGRLRLTAWIPVAVLWILELYTHYWGLFVVVSQLAYALLSAAERRRRLQFALAFAAALLVFAAWWPVLSFHLRETSAHSAEWFALGPADLGKTFAALSGYFFQFGNQLFVHPWRQWPVVAGVMLTAFLLLSGLLKGPRLAQLWLVIGIVVPFLISFYRPMYLWHRYPFLSYGAFVLLLVSGLSRVQSRLLRAVFVLFILSAEAAACIHYFNGWQKGNAKQAMDYVHRLQTGESVIVRPRYFGDIMSYYDRTPAANVIDEDRLDSMQARTALRRRRVIFISFDVPSDPVGEALRSELPIHSRRCFPAVPLHGITVYELGRQR